MKPYYLVHPKTDADLEDQAYYLAVEASPEVGHRFWWLHTKRSLFWPHSPRWGGILGSSIRP